MLCHGARCMQTDVCVASVQPAMGSSGSTRALGKYPAITNVTRTVTWLGPSRTARGVPCAIGTYRRGNETGHPFQNIVLERMGLITLTSGGNPSSQRKRPVHKRHTMALCPECQESQTGCDIKPQSPLSPLCSNVSPIYSYLFP